MRRAAVIAALVALAIAPVAGEVGAVILFLVAYALLCGLGGGFTLAPALQRSRLHRQPPG